jgi:hypothetical protein
MPETKPTNEADTFRAFAKKVVGVPKAVIDRREKDYAKSRETLKLARKAKS